MGVNTDGSSIFAWLRLHLPRAGEINPSFLPVGRQFDAHGRPVQGELFPSGLPPEIWPSIRGVMAQDGGGFLILWESVSVATYLRHYLPRGIPAGPPKQLQKAPRCSNPWKCGLFLEGHTVDSAGDLIGLWSFWDDDIPTLFVQRFNATGKPLGEKIEIPDHELRYSYFIIGLATGPENTFAIAWVDDPGLRSDHRSVIHVQRYSEDGVRLGTRFGQVVNGNFFAGRFAWNGPSQNFVLAWTNTEELPDPEGSNLDSRLDTFFVQRISLDGSALEAQPRILDKLSSSDTSIDLACNARGYCAMVWTDRTADERQGVATRLLRPDGSLTPRQIAMPLPQATEYCCHATVAYSERGHLVLAGTDYHGRPWTSNVVARRLVASPGDEVCQRMGRDVRCFAGQPGSGPTFSLLRFGLDEHEQLLFGDADGDGRADPCRVRSDVWRCDTDHEGGATETVLGFAGAASGTPLLGDLDGDGRAEACSWSAGMLRCDTARNGGAPELSLSYGRGDETPLLGDLDGDGRDDLCMASKGSLRCDVGHDGGRTEIRFAFGLPGDLLILGDFDGNGTDDPCLVRAGKLLCDTAHDGGEPDAELLLGTPGAPVLLGNLDGV